MSTQEETPNPPEFYCGKQDLSTTAKKCEKQCKECKEMRKYLKEHSSQPPKQK